MTLDEFLKNAKPVAFAPIPHLNVEGRLIEWYWDDARSYSEPIMHDGKWIGDVHREIEDGRPTGVSIHLEAVSGLGGWTPKGAD